MTLLTFHISFRGQTCRHLWWGRTSCVGCLTLLWGQGIGRACPVIPLCLTSARKPPTSAEEPSLLVTSLIDLSIFPSVLHQIYSFIQTHQLHLYINIRSIRPSLHQVIQPSTSDTVIYLFNLLSINLFKQPHKIFLSIYVFIQSSIHPPSHLSIQISTSDLSIYPSIYSSTLELSSLLDTSIHTRFIYTCNNP